MSKQVSSSSSSSGGVGFVGLLTIVLIVLKILGYIDWSWWWVWSPILISGGIFLAILAIVASVLVIQIIKERAKRV